MDRPSSDPPFRPPLLDNSTLRHNRGRMRDRATRSTSSARPKDRSISSTLPTRLIHLPDRLTLENHSHQPLGPMLRQDTMRPEEMVPAHLFTPAQPSHLAVRYSYPPERAESPLKHPPQHRVRRRKDLYPKLPVNRHRVDNRTMRGLVSKTPVARGCNSQMPNNSSITRISTTLTRRDTRRWASSLSSSSTIRME